MKPISTKILFKQNSSSVILQNDKIKFVLQRKREEYIVRMCIQVQRAVRIFFGHSLILMTVCYSKFSQIVVNDQLLILNASERPVFRRKLRILSYRFIYNPTVNIRVFILQSAVADICFQCLTI